VRNSVIAASDDELFSSFDVNEVNPADLISRASQRVLVARNSSMIGTNSKRNDSDESGSERPSFLGDLDEDLSNVIRFAAPYKRAERPEVSIVAVQEWEGYVDSIQDDYFTSVMYDVLSEKVRPDEIMEIPLSLVDPRDQDFLKLGSIFRLAIGRERRRGGPLQNKTLLYFRRGRLVGKEEGNRDKYMEQLKNWS
jgi:hypothetical protein